MTRFPYITKMQFGIIDQTHANTVFELADELQLMMPALRRLVSKSQFPGYNTFPAIIESTPTVLAVSQSSGDDDVAVRWRYKWKEAIADFGDDNTPVGWKERGDDGRTSDAVDGNQLDKSRWAVNMIEAGNTSSSSIVGPGIDIKGESYPEGFKPQPISEGTVVQLFVTTVIQDGGGGLVAAGDGGIGDGNADALPYFYFWCPNAHDGDCTE